ncbi:MAG: hypothetical protein P4L64_14380 [Caulobacteraceae bacterium]|nr:hypothetical protein [Caulobacteraceae bacterium]
MGRRAPTGRADALSLTISGVVKAAGAPEPLMFVGKILHVSVVGRAFGSVLGFREGHVSGAGEAFGVVAATFLGV